MTAAIYLQGKIVYCEGFGLADIENNVKATPETMFRTCSMGKTLTAAAIMQLEEKGRIDLNANIRNYCDFPAKPWPITTRELLSHLSGIRHYGGPHDRDEQFSTYHYLSIEESTKPFRDDPLAFEPGADYLYSTYGYEVASLVLEGVTKVPFIPYMIDRVFRPLGMKSIRDDDPAAVIPHRAAGYVMDHGTLRIAPHIDMSNRMGAGGWLTTASDLAIFAGALATGQVVKSAALREMMTPARMKNNSTANYGLGLTLWPDVSNADDVLIGFHGGSSPGASGVFLIYPKEQIAVVFMTNLEVLQNRFEEVMSLAEITLGHKIVATK